MYVHKSAFTRGVLQKGDRVQFKLGVRNEKVEANHVIKLSPAPPEKKNSVKCTGCFKSKSRDEFAKGQLGKGGKSRCLLCTQAQLITYDDVPAKVDIVRIHLTM